MSKPNNKNGVICSLRLDVPNRGRLDVIRCKSHRPNINYRALFAEASLLERDPSCDKSYVPRWTQAAQIDPRRKKSSFLFGENLCPTAFRHFTKCSRHKYYKLSEALAAGRSTPFLDDRTNNGPTPSIQKDVDNFCHYLYEFLAEPLAETDDITDFEEGLGTVLAKQHSNFRVGFPRISEIERYTMCRIP